MCLSQLPSKVLRAWWNRLPYSSLTLSWYSRKVSRWLYKKLSCYIKNSEFWQHISYDSLSCQQFLLPRKFSITTTNERHSFISLSIVFLAISLSRSSARNFCPSETLALIFRTTNTKQEECRLCVGSTHRQYFMRWHTASSSPAWYGAEEKLSFLYWQLDNW